MCCKFHPGRSLRSFHALAEGEKLQKVIFVKIFAGSGGKDVIFSSSSSFFLHCIKTLICGDFSEE